MTQINSGEYYRSPSGQIFKIKTVLSDAQIFVQKFIFGRTSILVEVSSDDLNKCRYIGQDSVLDALFDDTSVGAN